MSNAEDRKHVSLLESLYSDGGRAKSRIRPSQEARPNSETKGQDAQEVAPQSETDATSRRREATAAASARRAEEDPLPPQQIQPVSPSSSLEPADDVPFLEVPQRQRRRPLGGIISFILWYSCKSYE